MFVGDLLEVLDAIFYLHICICDVINSVGESRIARRKNGSD
jgi:hypothetical protein